MKTLLFILIWFFSFTSAVFAGAIDFRDAPSSPHSVIWEVSIDAKTGDIEYQLRTTTENILKTIKVILWWLLVIYMVYTGIMMVMSMGSDEGQLSESKRSLWYALIGLFFINMPGSILKAFSWQRLQSSTWNSDFTEVTRDYSWNIFVNFTEFTLRTGVLWNLVIFLQITVVALAVFMIVFSGIKMMMAGWDEEKVSNTKSKILWSLAWLIFIAVMEVWKYIMITGEFTTRGEELFSRLANLALFFAGPIAIFFLSLAGYYYITSGWDEERVKKAKNIVLYTLFATLILIGIYTFLLDIWDLTFGD